jgi:hypothetical protein
MHLGKRLLTAVLAAGVATAAQSLVAVEIDDFNAYPAGTIVATGGNVTGGVWSTLGTNNAVIEDSAGNKVLTYGAGSNSHAWRPLAAGTQVNESDTATLFFRYRANAANPNNSIGLSTINPVTDANNFGVYDAQIRAVADVAGAFRLEARNAGAFSLLMGSLTPGTFYNVWMVISHPTDSMDVYVNSGSQGATAAHLVGENITFRNSAPGMPVTSPLVSFLAYGGAGPVLGGSLDEIHLTPGASLVNPAFPNFVAGDTDGDGVVEDSDLTPISQNFLNSVTMRSQGDLNLDGIVNFADFREWKTARFPAAVSGNAVPEPANFGPFAVAAAVLFARRRG